MTKKEADFIGSMNMCDEISNEAYKKIMCNCEDEESQQTRWIPISERLPEEEGEYLVVKHLVVKAKKINDYIIDIAKWSSENEFNNGFHKAFEVLAWRPLPEYHREKSITEIEEWLSTFNTESATECFTAVQRLKESADDRLDEGYKG